MREYRQPHPLQNLIGQRPRKPHRSDRARFAHLLPSAQRNQFHIVHDDEVIKVRHQLLKLIGRNLQFQP